MTLIFLIFVLISILKGFFSQAQMTVLFNSIAQLDSSSQIINGNIGSSWEGHSLLILQGYGFYQISSLTLNCVFTSSDGTKIYKSYINNNQAVCAENDYYCLYWQTIYQTSDTTLGCYTPQIPYEDRKGLILSNNLNFQVSLQVTDKVNNVNYSVNCPANSSWKCMVTFNDNYTPLFYDFGPAHMYSGGSALMWTMPKFNGINKLRGLRIGEGLCSPQISDDYHSDWNNMFLECQTGSELSAGSKGGFLIDYTYGQPSVNSLRKRYQIDPNVFPGMYYFKVFPFIQSVSQSSGSSLGGQMITITGNGYSLTDTQVYINKDLCDTQLSVQKNSISCITPAITFDFNDPTNTYLGSRGLRHRFYTNVGSVDRVLQIAASPDPTNNLSFEDVILETQTPPFNQNSYGQLMQGYFKAPYTGNYRFHSNCDDVLRVLLSTDETSENLVKIIDVTWHTQIHDFLSQAYRTTSEWIHLIADTYYYMEIVHVQYGGYDYFQLGVEINSTDISPTDPNIITNIDRVDIYPTSVSKDLYEVLVETLVKNVTTLTCKMLDNKTLKSINIDPSFTAQAFRNALSNLIGVRNLIVRKVGYNDQGEYYLADGQKFDDSSHTNAYNFGDLYLNINGLDSNNSIPLNTVNNGTEIGVVFLVFFDEIASQRNFDPAQRCFISINETITEITHLQDVSPDLDGQFTFLVTSNVDNTISYESPELNIRGFNINQMKYSLMQVPLLTNNIELFYTGSGNNNVTFYIRYSKDANVTLTVNTNKLTGGLVNIVVIDLYSVVENPANIFLMPIPPDYLYVNIASPQIRVVSNGLEAVCFSDVCSYEIVDVNYYPKIISHAFDYNLQTLTVNLDSSFTNTSLVTSIGLGENYCVNPQVQDADGLILSCTLPQPIIGGNYTVFLTTNLGYIDSNDTTITQIPITVTSVTPNQALSLGGATITIVGTGFPLNDLTELDITAGGSPCLVQTTNNTVITCVLGPQITSDPLDISYLGVTAGVTPNIFTYVPPDSNPPTVLSINPDSVAPGEKQTLSIILDEDISSYSLDTIVVKLIHTTIANYQIQMNPTSINNDTLNVAFGGAKMGEYKLYLQLDSDNFANSTIQFTVEVKILGMYPTIGSIMGGTIVTITGVNFLSTQLNQVVYMGTTPCKYITNDSSSIKCITQVPISSTPIDSVQSVAVEQMIQYDSLCLDASLCSFTYSTAKTSTIYNIMSIMDDYVFELDDDITINGSNIQISEVPSLLEFNWGQINVTNASDTQVNGTITRIYTYGIINFDFSDDNGLAIQQPSGFSLLPGQTNLFIFLQKPLDITSISTTSIGEYGAILKFYTDITDFQDNTDSNGNILNTITICDYNCDVLAYNYLDDPDNNFQCIINTMTPSSNFIDCRVVATYFQNTIKLDNITISADSTNDRSISLMTIDDVDVTSKSFTINDSANFLLKIHISTIDVNMTDLKLIVNNEYVFDVDAPATTTDISGNAIYEFNLTSGLPSGLISCAIHSDSLGFIQPPKSITVKDSLNNPTPYFNLEIPLELTAFDTLTITNSSFYGGVLTEITGVNLNNMISSFSDELIYSSNSFQQVYVCDLLAKVTEYSSTSIQFRTPAILKYDFFFNKNILTENQINLLFDNTYSNIIEQTSDSSTRNKAALIDNNPFTYISTSLTSWVGIGVKSTANPNFKILLNKIQLIVGKNARPNDFSSAYIEGSNDGSTWTQLATLPSNLLFQWTNIYLNNSPNNSPYSFIRLVPNASTSISEIRYWGNVVYQTTDTTVRCQVKITDNHNKVTVNNFNILYDLAKTYSISSVSPLSGPSVGGTSVTFELSSGNTVSASDNIIISIYGNEVEDNIVIGQNGDMATLEAITTAKNNMNYDPNSPLVIYIHSIGYVYSDIYFQYLDRWSDVNTWGGEFYPNNGETAFITNANIILDVPNINLNTLVIENGSLTVEDSQDYQFSANIILVRSGSLTIGTEDSPFQHNFVLTLKGERTDPVLPIFGNKALAVMEGHLDIHGIAKTPTFTFLNKTCTAGSSQIKIVGPVNWEVGDEIVIASSNTNPWEAELRKIILITNANNAIVTITLDKSLKFTHYGAIESYGVNDLFDMRAEVAVLTRNVVIQGDKYSPATQYGAHVMLTAMKMNMNTATNIITSGKISSVEVRYAGQAFQQGRYPLHFHMIGDISGSYIKGCSVHNTYNRAITIHGVSNFLVDSNVAYNVMGHTFFIEDGVEIYNTISHNIGILTRASSSLMNADMNPATFWITNPSNYIFGNHAAGSEFYGMWMDIPPAPTGMNLGVKLCPMNLPLGSFRDNVSHSNGKYGIRLFPEFNPISVNCGQVDGVNVVTVQAVFSNLTMYANSQKGLVTEIIGNVIFENIRSADHSMSSMETSNLDQFPQGMAGFHNSFIVGKSQNPVVNKDGFRTSGLITPRADRFMVDNIRFYSFNGLSLFASCSRCDVSDASTDSDGRTIFFQNIKSDGTESSRVHWTPPRRAIFRDLDGTLTNSNGPAWATPYYVHNNVTQCKRNIDLWDDGSICDNTIQVRRIAVSNAQPFSDFVGQDLMVMRLFNKLDDINATDLTNKTNFSVVPFQKLRNPNNAWTIAFVTGYNYLLSFDRIGLDFNSLNLERSQMWNTTDRPVNLVFNYTYRRDEFNISGKDNSGNTYYVNNITNLSLINGNFMESNNDINYGAFYNNINDTYPKDLCMRVNGYNPENYTNLVLTVKAIQCANNYCGLEDNRGEKENITRKWSDVTNWPNNQLPAKGDIVEILASWNMVLDISTPELQMLTIKGTLFFDPTKSGLVLNSNNIFIYGGVLQIGSIDTPYINQATVALSGNKFSPNIAIDNSFQTTNNAIVNIGTINIYGENRSPYVSRLQVAASKGDSSIKVDMNLKWVPNDLIVLTTTTHNSSQTELLTISSYDKTTGIIQFSPSLQYDHYGAADVTVFPDNTLNPAVDLDERAQVFMLSRNVSVTGNSKWGGNIYTTTYQTSNMTYYGVLNITHAQILKGGQTDSQYSALQFKKHNTPNSVSIIDGVSFHDFSYVGLQIEDSQNITINDVIMFKPQRYGIKILNSQNILVNETSVVKMLNRFYPKQNTVNTIIDMNACYVICVESGTCQNVNLVNTMCAGSESYGYFLKAFDCSNDLTQNLAYNYAHSTENAFIVMNPNKNTCVKGGNVVAYNNKVGYVSFSQQDLSVHENIISSNNLQGIVIMSGSDNFNTRKILNRALIIGQNRENPICIDRSFCNKQDICKQIGFLFSLTGTGQGLPFPLTKHNIPIFNVMGDAQYGSFLNANNVAFVNFEDQCSIDQYAFNSNPFESDGNSVHNFLGVRLTRVISDNLVFFEIPPPKWIGDECGKIPCTGPNNILLKFTNFVQSLDTFDNSQIVQNPKWGNSSNNSQNNRRILQGISGQNTKSYIFTNNANSAVPIVDGMEFMSSNPVELMVNCDKFYQTNTLACNPSRNLGVLWFENLDSEGETRNVSPINITSTDPNDPFNNTINAFMDHGCQFGYPDFTRTPRFISIVPLGKHLTVNFTSTNPKSMKFDLVDPNWDNNLYNFNTYTYNPNLQVPSGITIKMKYQSPQTIVVFNLLTNKEIKSKTYVENEAFNDLKCGGNKWTPVANTLEFYLTNSPDCRLLLNTVDSIQLSMRLALSVEKFFSVNGSNSLIYNVAAVLGIPVEQIRISSVRTGSTIIDMSVLSSVPSLDSTNSTNGTATVTNSTQTLNLTNAATTIANSISSKTLALPAPLLSFSAQVSQASPGGSGSIIKNNISINPGGAITTYTTLTYPIDYDNSMVEPKEYIKYMLIIICILIGSLIVGFGIYCLVSSLKPKVPYTKTNKGPVEDNNMIEVIPFHMTSVPGTPNSINNFVTKKGD